MKRGFVIIIVMLVCKVYVMYAQPVREHGQLRIDGMHMADQHNQIIALKGISLGWHNWWPQYYNASVVDHLSNDWQINVIRAAMGVEPAGGYLENPEQSVAMIRTVIDAAIKNDIYVIVDWHSHGIYTEQAELFFTTIAQQYADYPHIIYEIFNEPEEGISWQDIKKYAVRIIEAIRKHDKDNPIIVGTPNWSHDVDVVANDPILGYDNIAYSLHFYAASHDYVRSKAEHAIRMRLPLFVSECSPSFADGNGELDKKRFATWLNFLDRNKIGFVLWGLYDKEESSAMLKPKADHDGYWPNSQLTEMGVYTRRLIKGESSLRGFIVPIIAGFFIAIIAFVLYRKRVR